MTQLELWNDTPTPWKKRMEDDAFAIAFPDEERQEGDEVEVSWSYEHCMGGSCATCGWHEESDLEAVVSWTRWVPRVSRDNPNNRRPPRRETARKVYERGDALRFWKQLMQRGSK